MIEKKILEDQAIRRCDLIIRGFTTFENMREFAEICKQALEENQQYRELGTVEDYWKLNEMCKEYSAIGTIEELKALKEKNEKLMQSQECIRMGRLIDADKTIKKMWSLWNSDINNSVKFSDEETQAVTRAFKRLQKAIEKQPTAYDVEKVKDALENHPNVFQEFKGSYIPLENAVEVVQSNDGKGWWNE